MAFSVALTASYAKVSNLMIEPRTYCFYRSVIEHYYIVPGNKHKQSRFSIYRFHPYNAIRLYLKMVCRVLYFLPFVRIKIDAITMQSLNIDFQRARLPASLEILPRVER